MPISRLAFRARLTPNQFSEPGGTAILHVLFSVISVLHLCVKSGASPAQPSAF
jgi:hypothetical protein